MVEADRDSNGFVIELQGAIGIIIVMRVTRYSEIRILR